MAANNAVVGILRAMLTADTASFDTGMRKAGDTLKLVGDKTKKVGEEVAKLTPQAERMVKAFSGDKMIYTANSLVAAITKVGGATKLSESQQANANKTLTDAIALYVRLGKTVPAAWAQAAEATKKVIPPTEAVAQRLSLMDRAASSLKGSFAQMFASFTLAGLATRAITAMAFGLQEAAANGNKLAGLSRSFNQLTRSIGESRDAMLTATRTGTKGLVSDLDLMQASNKAILLGLPVTAAEMGKLAQTAVALGTAMGQDATKSLDDLITALGRSSPMILDNLGLSVKLGEAHETYARQIGKTVDALTDAERKTAFYNAAMAAAEVKVTDLGGVQLTLTDQLIRTSVALGGVVTGMFAGVNQAPRLVNWFGRLADSAGQFRQRLDDVAEAQRRLEKRGVSLLDDRSIQGEVDSISVARSLAIARGILEGRSKPLELPKLGKPVTDAEIRALEESSKKLEQLFEETLKWTADNAKSLAGTLSEIRNQIGMTQFGAGAAAEQAAAHALASMDAFNEEAEQKDEAYARSKRQLTNELEEQRITAHGTANNEIARQDTQLRAIQNELGEVVIREAQERQDRANAQRQRIVDFWKRQAGSLEAATLGRIGTLAFGNLGHDVTGELKAAADEAELDFLRIKRSGRATAKELQIAFDRWREAEDRANFSFGERWTQFMGGIKQTFVGVLDDMLGYFLKQFLGGLIKGIAGARLGQAIGNALMGTVAGTAIGGGAAVATGAVAGSAAGGTAAAAGTAGGGATLAALATNPWTIGAAGGVALGLLIAKKGLFRGGEEAMHVNPRRDQFTAQFGGGHNLAARLTGLSGEHGGGHLFAALQRADSVKEFEAAQSAIAAFLGQFKQRVKLFNFGGFVPPGVTQPAILHGGAFGEDVISRTSSQPSAGPSLSIHNTFNISSIDARGVREFVESRDFLDSFARVIEHNKGFIATRVRPSLVS